jgi:hypothetical protein
MAKKKQDLGKMKMKKRILSEKIILVELIGFGILILFLWIDEIFDIPHYIFGSSTTPLNLTESIFETTVVLILCFIIVLLTLGLLTRIKSIEGFLPICSSCRKVKVGNSWIQVDDYIKKYSDAELIDSLCPECTLKQRKSLISD